MTKYLTPEEIAALPPETRIVPDPDFAHEDARRWMDPEQIKKMMEGTARTDLPPSQCESAPKRLADLDLAKVEQRVFALQPYQREIMEKLVEAKDRTRIAVILGSASAAAAAMFAKLDAQERMSGHRPGFIIVDDPEAADAGTNLTKQMGQMIDAMPEWPVWNDKYRLDDLRRYELKPDEWRKQYLTEFRAEPEPTEKERKAAHRETYLRHNKTRSKKGGRHRGF